MNKNSTKSRLFLLLRVLVLMSVLLLLNSIARLLLYVFNYNLFDIKFSQFLYYFFAGLRFDLYSLFFANSLFLFLFFLPQANFHKGYYKKILFYLALLPNLLIILPNIIDAFYYPFIFRRSSYDTILMIFNLKNEMSSLWLDFLRDFWLAIVLIIVFCFLLIIILKKFFKYKSYKNKGVQAYFQSSFIFIFILFISFISIRGGFQRRPISLVTASKYAQSNHTPLVLNSSFSIIRTWNKIGLVKKTFFKNENELEKHFQAYKNYNKSSFKKKNIVIIILESFSCEHLSSLNTDNPIDKNKNFAPFLDSLIYESYFCSNAFANGKRSIEGIPAILSSIPTLMYSPFILSPYINNNFPSIASLLKKESYYSIFYHGGHNGTMNFDAYVKLAGFEKYSGKNEYPNPEHFDGNWGIRDEEYLQFIVEDISKIQQTFIAAIFTLSSHHPYTVPEKYKNTLPDGPLKIHKSIAYADMALKKFFETASTKEWYNNTLFVICSDHSSEPYLNYYKSPAGLFSIPILFYEPGSNLKGKYTKTCQQIDIMPSILDYIAYPHKFFSFGSSIFDSLNNNIAISFSNNNYQIISDSTIMTFNDDKPIKLWNYKNDWTGENNLIEDENYQNKKDSLYLFYKAFIQFYNNSLIDNSIKQIP